MKNLIELHELRAQEKAIKARINAISNAAEQEALSLAPNGGQFTHEGLTFQLQLTEVIDFSDHQSPMCSLVHQRVRRLQAFDRADHGRGSGS